MLEGVLLTQSEQVWEHQRRAPMINLPALSQLRSRGSKNLVSSVGIEPETFNWTARLSTLYMVPIKYTVTEGDVFLDKERITCFML
jgi:hypothetical protein